MTSPRKLLLVTLALWGLAAAFVVGVMVLGRQKPGDAPPSRSGARDSQPGDRAEVVPTPPPDPEALKNEFLRHLERTGVRRDSLSPHEERVREAVWSACRDYRVPEDSVEVLDTAPKTPFLLILERSQSYNSSLFLSAMRQACERFCEVFAAEFGDRLGSPAPAEDEVLTLFVFESREKYSRLGDSQVSWGGHFSSRNGRITMYRDTNVVYETLFHLCTHALLHQAWLRRGGDPSVPALDEMAWFSEGLSAWFESFKRDARGDFILGQVSPSYLPGARKLIADGRQMRLTELMGMSFETYVGKRRESRWNIQFSAQCWALVHFLQRANGGKYRDKFHEYVALEIAGRGGLEAAKACFGDLDVLEREYAEYVRDLR